MDRRVMVSQTEELGVLGLSALSSEGVCESDCDLNDAPVVVSEVASGFRIHFCDMVCTIREGHELYDKITNAYRKKEEQLREREESDRKILENIPGAQFFGCGGEKI